MSVMNKEDLVYQLKKHMDYSQGRNHAYLKGVRDAIKIVENFEEVKE